VPTPFVTVGATILPHRRTCPRRPSVSNTSIQTSNQAAAPGEESPPADSVVEEHLVEEPVVEELLVEELLVEEVSIDGMCGVY